MSSYLPLHFQYAGLEEETFKLKVLVNASLADAERLGVLAMCGVIFSFLRRSPYQCLQFLPDRGLRWWSPGSGPFRASLAPRARVDETCIHYSVIHVKIKFVCPSCSIS